MIPLAVVIMLFATAAHASDYWSNCEQAYEFCERRAYHRDCRIWTHWGRPLDILKWQHLQKNPAADTEFCKSNQWHMACGRGGGVEFYAEECPIPERYHPIDGVMPWAQTKRK
jgi:hypothetical protein